MQGTKILLSFWLATATFCLLQILFGPGGLSETDRLRDQKARLETRLAALGEENERLAARYEALRTSPEAVRLEARSLGWFSPGEIPVRTLEGLEFRLPSEEPDLSTVPVLSQTEPDLSLFFRVAWFLLFVLYYSFFLLWSKLWPAETRPEPRYPVLRNNLALPLQTGLDFFRK